jgi:ABC-type sugar transport system ATPase subunit
VSPGALVKRAAALLARCGIALDPRAIAGHLNASQRQLVMIARALAREPSLLILDEATASLTLDEADNLFKVLHHLRDQGCTCLYITHKLSEVVEMADRATVLRDGAWVADFARDRSGGSVGFNLTDLITAMVGRKLEQLFPPRRPFTGGEEALRVTGLNIPHPRLAGRNLVEDVSFSVQRGEVLGLGGLVGAGRSEVLRAIYGLLPCTGKIAIAGRPVRIRSSAEAMRQGLGLLTEDRKRDGLLFNFAIRENTTLHALLRFQRGGFLSRRRERACAEDFRVRLGIRANDISVMVNTLSGGNQQKVVLAKMLLPGPRVLLLDEPTKGIDVGAKAEIYSIINALAEQGNAVVLVSSDLPEILAMCDRHVVLARGRVSDTFDRSEADENRFMRAAVGGD